MVTLHPVLIALLMQKDKPLPSMDSTDVPLLVSLINKQSDIIARLGPMFDMTIVIKAIRIIKVDSCSFVKCPSNAIQNARSCVLDKNSDSEILKWAILYNFNPLLML